MHPEEILKNMNSDYLDHWQVHDVSLRMMSNPFSIAEVLLTPVRRLGRRASCGS